MAEAPRPTRLPAAACGPSGPFASLAAVRLRNSQPGQTYARLRIPAARNGRLGRPIRGQVPRSRLPSARQGQRVGLPDMGRRFHLGPRSGGAPTCRSESRIRTRPVQMGDHAEAHTARTPPASTDPTDSPPSVGTAAVASATHHAYWYNPLDIVPYSQGGCQPDCFLVGAPVNSSRGLDEPGGVVAR